MLLLIIVLGIVAVIGGVFIYEYTNAVNTGVSIGVIGGILAFIACVAFAFIIGPCVESTTVNERIAMYQEENAKIEQQIAEVVTQYQEYEKDIFTEVSPESAMTLVTLYPELKADSLVSQQIDIYVKNNEKIKSLKEQQINGHLYRWWVYFGG